MEDLDSIHDYIARDSRFHARRAVERIIERTKGLEKFPARGRIVAEFCDPHLRALKEGSYRIVYRLLREEVVVVCVWHSARRMLPVKRFE